MWQTAVLPTMYFMMTPATVMIIESQPLMRMALSKALAAEGMTVLAELTHSHELQSWFPGQSPDLILFSLSEVDQDELTMITTLRDTLPQTTIAALITGERREEAQAALASGAHMVLEKTLPRTALLEALSVTGSEWH